MANLFDNDDCPDLFTGVNCTESWKEYLEPYGFTYLKYLHVAAYAFCSLSTTYLLYSTFAERNWKWKEVPSVKVYTVVCVWVMALSWTIFFALGGGIEYELDTPLGKLVNVAQWFGAIFFFQAANWLSVMYIGLLSSTLEKKGMLESINLKTARRLAILWPCYVALIISLLMFAFDFYVDSVYKAWRIAFGVILYPLIITITISSYYYIRLAQMLERAIKSATEGNTPRKRSVYSQWKQIAKTARMLGYFAIFVGTPAFVFCLLSVIFDWFANPLCYFIFQFIIAGFAIFLATFIFLAQFTKSFACFRIDISKLHLSRRFSKLKGVPTPAISPKDTTDSDVSISEFPSM
uniref:Uncharacterized protein n=1 Tax=Aplanochytrium stocchinoi TaxID=215587 RepID=A0A7S3V275_9STRA